MDGGHLIPKFGFGATVLISVVTVSASAQTGGVSTYPGRPIRLVVGFPPGGSGDFIARNMAEDMNRRTGQQIIVDNRPGAGANIASELVARANADGYTM